MRFTGLVILVGSVLMASLGPAQAQWRGYVSHDLGISFHAPGEMVTESGVYTAERSGEHPSVVYRSSADNIEYKVVATDFRDRVDDGASLVIEAASTFQTGHNALMEAYARIDETFGRKITIDLPDNGGRTMASFYFHDGFLYQTFATVLPANGDYGTPLMGRFIDSLSFIEDGNARVNEDVIELGLPD
nr:MAG: hypothetical protein E4H34_01265 [Hyphomicrobiales bacterium]